MTLPASITQVAIYGTLVYQAGDLAGTPVQGYITFSPSVTVDVPVDELSVPRSTMRADLDADGSFQINLLATDDADGEPTGWTYTVSEHFNRGGGRGTFSVEIPSAMAPSGFYGDLTPAVASSGLVSYATTAQLATKVDIAGDTMTGALILSGAPAVPLQAATKAYVDSVAGGGTPSTTVESETSLAITPAAGTDTEYSRGDHTHGSPTAATIAAAVQALLTIAQSQVTDLTTDLGNKQPLDSDLTTIAGLTATTDNFLQSKSSAWASRTPAQVASDLQALLTIAESQVTGLTAALAAKQPLDADLTTIAGLTATTDNIIQSAGSAWASRTPTQVKTALSLNNVDNTSDTNKPVSTATQTALNLKANLASPTFTGTVTAATLALTDRLSIAPEALVDAATIATDASLGNHFRVTLTDNRTLGNPTNAVDGQKMMWEIIQDAGGSNTLTLGNKFKLGTDIADVTLSTTGNARDFLGVVYNSTADLFYVIAFVKGY